MFTKSILFSSVIIGSFSLLSNTVMAGQASQNLQIKANPKAAIAYWTPENMRNAVPMSLPKPNIHAMVKLAANELMQQYKGVKPITVEAKAPAVQVVPENNLLFQPILQKSKYGFNAGTLAEPFTSSQLTPLSADQSYPYTAVGKVFFTTPSGNKTCSGAVISERIVLTAGHCVHSGVGGGAGWYSNWTFVPAFRSGNAPFKTWTASSAVATGTWVNGGGTVPNAGDWALLVMSDQIISGVVQSIGSVVGTLGFQTLSTIPNHATILGYPGNLDSGQIMHQVTSQSALAVAPNNAEYGSDMSLGSGGGPWIQNFGAASTGETTGTNTGRNLIVGLSSYGYNDTVSLAEGSSILNAAFASLYTLVCADATGNC